MPLMQWWGQRVEGGRTLWRRAKDSLGGISKALMSAFSYEENNWESFPFLRFSFHYPREPVSCSCCKTISNS